MLVVSVTGGADLGRVHLPVPGRRALNPPGAHTVTRLVTLENRVRQTGVPPLEWPGVCGATGYVYDRQGLEQLGLPGFRICATCLAVASSTVMAPARAAA